MSTSDEAIGPDPTPSEAVAPPMHWECPVCEFDDGEAGYLLPDGDHWCPLCAEDNGRDTLLRMTRIADLSAKSA